MALDSRRDSFRALARSVAPSVLGLGALLLTLWVAAALSGSRPETGNVNAQRYAAADIENVVGYAVDSSVSSGRPPTLTYAGLAAAITEDRRSATGASAHVVISSIRRGRAFLTLNTPWQRDVCAWVPLTFSGLASDWPVNFCARG